MAKVLKIIVNIFIIAAILSAAAILVPPVLGVTTTIIDTDTVATNLPMGSITYSKDINVTELKNGDKVLKESDSEIYAYIIQSGEAASGQYQVLSATDSAASEETIVLRNNVSKIVLTVPYIGYILVAMHTMEGIIIIALVVLLMIIFFVLSELWKKDDSGEEDDEEDMDNENDDDETSNRKKKRKSRSSRQNEEEIYEEYDEDEEGPDDDGDDDEGLSRKEKKAEKKQRKEEKKKKKEKKQREAEKRKEKKASRRQGKDDNEAEDFEGEAAFEVNENTSRGGSSLPKEDYLGAMNISETDKVADAFSVSSAFNEQEKTAAEETATERAAEKEPIMPEAAEAGEQKNHETVSGQEIIYEEAAYEEEASSDDGRFVPVSRLTLEELKEQAEKNGEDPLLIKDPTTGVTLLDYSDLL